MKLHFLGGANEVGASCTLLEVGGYRILVDAGIRMGSTDDPLPDLETLQKLGGPDLILVTHAHADHIGALPLIHLAYPTAPVVTTSPTKALMEILLGDALKIMDIKWEKEEDIPLYPPHAVEGLLSRVQTIDIHQDIPLLNSLTANFTPCGHVLGACSISLETSEGHIFFAGDYSLDRQKTVEGFKVPKSRPDVVITESTYGNRLHANRSKEECRLVDTVSNVIAQKGKALIPAFALGRAQEVLLILLDAKQRGQLPDVPIYVDGLVRRICGIYQNHLPFLNKKLAQAITKEGNPFFGEGKATAVTAPKREAIATGPPCIIVSSSGMLTGGPSAFYASHLVTEPNNAILITGYQDEESPGRALLNLVDKVEKGHQGTLSIANRVCNVSCQVKRYGLSAHADAAQMASVVSTLKPRHAVLVHGDQDARPALSRLLPASMAVHLPSNGDTISWKPFRKGKKASPVAPKAFGEGRPLTAASLHQKLLSQGKAGSRLTLEELDQFWYGDRCSERIQSLEKELGKNPGFLSDPRRPELIRILPPKTPKSQALKVTQVVQFVTNLFKEEPNFHKTSNKQAQRRLTLHFYFPEKAVGYDEALEMIAAHTGWSVSISNQPNVQKLTELAGSLLPKDVEISKISVFPNEPRVRIKHHPSETLTPERTLQLQKLFLEQSGRHLEFQSSGQAPKKSEKPASTCGMLEQNQALSLIRQSFEQKNVTLYRCGRKENGQGPYLELSFISPHIGERYQDLIQELEHRTGWPISYRKQPNPIALIDLVKSFIPPEWGVTKQPGFHQDKNLVKLKVPTLPEPSEKERLEQLVLKATGYQLIVTM